MIIPSSSYGVIASSRKIIVAGGGGAADVTPTPALNWTNVLECDANGSCQDYTEEQIQGINQTITLTFTVYSASGTPPSVYYRKAATSVAAGYGGYCGPPVYGNGSPPAEGSSNGFSDVLYDGSSLITTSLNVSSGDYLAFIAFGNSPFGGEDLIIDVKNQSDGNILIQALAFYHVSGCLLTTAVVNYMNLQDNGPELTAMRQLREHFKNVPGYSEIIQEYYQNSSTIISNIQNSNMQEIEYTYIYNTVIAVKNHVDAEEWQQAHDLYMAMYNDLKTRYLN